MDDVLTMGNIILTTANVLYIFSYLVKDILWLRVLTVIAAGTLLIYYFLNNLMMPIYWSTLFIGINLVQIYLLILERRPVKFSEEEGELYSIAFRSLSPREFKQLLDLGSWGEASDGQTIVSMSEKVNKLIVLYKGEVDIHTADKNLARLSPGKFIGEMSYLTGKLPAAEAVADGPVRYFSWPFHPLKDFLAKHSDLRLAMQMCISNDLVNKLRGRGPVDCK